jgi:hypothetical protein
MQKIDTYAKESYLRLLLQGSPGTGKTTLGCAFPGAYIADCDLNWAALRYLRKNNGTLPLATTSPIVTMAKRSRPPSATSVSQMPQRRDQRPHCSNHVVDSATKPPIT